MSLRWSYCLAFALFGAMIPAAAAPALAEERLLAYEEAPFPVAVHRRLSVQWLPITHPQGLNFARILPLDTSGGDLLVFKWPKSNNTVTLAIVQAGEVTGGVLGDPAPGSARAAPRILFALQAGDGAPEEIVFEDEQASGFLARLCVWPTSIGPDADLIMLFGLSSVWEDTRISCLRITPAGAVSMVDTGGARAELGYFELADLDGDGLFELITSRNLDGAAGGFSYRSVRSFDPDMDFYLPAPGKHMSFFREELAWLDWVVSMRQAIQDDPEEYLNESGMGPVYQAGYQGAVYPFDSVIELPETYTGAIDVASYNRRCREAFSLVRGYRDDLADWLAGGEYPSAWKLSR